MTPDPPFRPYRAMVRLCVCVCVLALAACGEPEAPIVAPLEPPPAEQGFQLKMEVTAEPGAELWKCAVYRIPIEQLAAVNKVVYQQNNGMHHMTLSTPSLNGVSYPYGIHDCDDLEGLMDNSTMFFGSQGEPDGSLQLPVGVAASLPAGIDIVHEVHYVNTTMEPVKVYSRVNAYTIAQDAVEKGIWGGQVRDEHIQIPASGEHTEWTRCVMNEDVEVLFVASHTHRRGVRFTVAPYDGTTVGEIFYENTDWHSPKIVQYEQPMKLKAGQGFEYRCTWRNNDPTAVQYGLNAEDEMCNLTLVHTPFSQSAECTVVETSDGVLWRR